MLINKDIQDIKSYKNFHVILTIIKLIKQSKNIAVLSHKEPDGDAIGSQISLAAALNQSGYKADAINEGPFDNKFAVKFKKNFKKEINKEYDLYIIIDTPSLERIGLFYNKVNPEKIIVIDHHFTNSNFGIVNWVDSGFLSSSEMIFMLLLNMDADFSKNNISQHLLNGIISDTGYFLHLRKENVFSLLASYMLIKNGADPRISYNIMFGGKSLYNKKLMALALQRIELLHNGKIVWTYLSNMDKKKNSNSSIDTIDIFKEMLSIESVYVAIYFKINKNKIDISFRSNDMVDVASLAKLLGGGGHKAAAGVTINGKFDLIKEKVIQTTIDYLK